MALRFDGAVVCTEISVQSAEPTFWGGGGGRGRPVPSAFLRMWLSYFLPLVFIWFFVFYFIFFCCFGFLPLGGVECARNWKSRIMGAPSLAIQQLGYLLAQWSFPHYLCCLLVLWLQYSLFSSFSCKRVGFGWGEPGTLRKWPCRPDR